jgi:hypothetical protein
MTTDRRKTPILLLQWLNRREKKEARTAFRKFRKEVQIRYAEAVTKAEALRAIRSWLSRNPNAQFLYIGSHGARHGLGANGREYISWPALGRFLRRHGQPVVLWLGACDSAFAAEQWKVRRLRSARYVVGFQKTVYTYQLEPALKLLLRMTRIDNVIGADEELPRLRKLLPRTRITMHYPVCLKGKRMYRYVNVDRLPDEFGFTLTEYLDNRHRLARKAKARRTRNRDLREHR